MVERRKRLNFVSEEEYHQRAREEVVQRQDELVQSELKEVALGSQLFNLKVCDILHFLLIISIPL